MAAGRVLTAGELIEHLQTLAPEAPVYVTWCGESTPLVSADLAELRTAHGDDDPSEEMTKVLENLRDFTGPKRDMLKIVSNYFGD